MLVSSGCTAVGASATLPTLLHSSEGPAPAVVAIGVVVVSLTAFVVMLVEFRKVRGRKDR
jgi:hypothetical protein